MSPQAHSPLPWKVVKDLGGPSIRDADERWVMHISSATFGGPDDCHATAAFIVACVNSHDTLVAQRDSLVSALRDLIRADSNIRADWRLQDRDPYMVQYAALDVARTLLAQLCEGK